MASKYYAVRKGKTPGIYNSWSECKLQVDGFSGAEYKSFKSEEEAREYIEDNNSEQKNMNNSVQNGNNLVIEAYVDVVYNNKPNNFNIVLFLIKIGKN